MGLNLRSDSMQPSSPSPQCLVGSVSGPLDVMESWGPAAS